MSQDTLVLRKNCNLQADERREFESINSAANEKALPEDPRL